MKPDWKDAPEWAHYLAMDNDGSWVWYEVEPHSGESMWIVDETTRYYGYSPDPLSWKSTLEQRPLTTTDSVLQFPYGDCGQYMEENE